MRTLNSLTAPAGALLIVLSLAQPAVASEPVFEYGEWEFVREGHGIVVHRREVKGSPLHEFRGRGVVKAPIERVYAVVRDAERRTQWMGNCAASWGIDLRDAEQTIYYRTKAPWPLFDRDVILYGKSGIDLDNGVWVVPFASVEHPEGPEVKGVVRMPFLRGHWKLFPQEGGKETLVEYQVHADPGGSLPNWVVNWVSRKLPYETLLGLRRQADEVSYPEDEAAAKADPKYRQLVGRAKAKPATAQTGEE